MSRLIMLCGIPGSGKSYFSNLCLKKKNSHLYIVASDTVRTEVTGYIQNFTAEAVVWKMVHDLVVARSGDKDGIVILDATNVSVEDRMTYNADIKKYFDEVYLVVFYLNKEETLKQNVNREHPVKEEIMDKFFSRFEFPNDEEKATYHKVFIINCHDDFDKIADQILK